MDLKPDIAFRSSDGNDPDRVRADIELLNQRMEVLAANIRTIASAVSDHQNQKPTVIEEKVTVAPGGGLIDTENGIAINIFGLPDGSTAGDAWLLVEGEDGGLFRVPMADFVTKPAIASASLVPTLAQRGTMVPSSWSGSTAVVTRDELYGISANIDIEINKVRDVVEPTLSLLRSISADGSP